MRSLLLLALLCLVASTVHAQPRYLHLEGTIGKAPVMFDLYKDGRYVAGTYYYQKVGQPISVGHGAEDPGSGDTLVLEEALRTDTANTVNSIRLRPTVSGYTGIWRSGDGRRSLPVELRESYPPGSMRFTPFSLLDSGSTRIRPTIPATATASYAVELPDQNAPAAAGQFVAGQISKVLGCESGTPEDCIRKMTRSYIDTALLEFRETYADMPDSDLAMGGIEQYNYSQDEQIHVTYNSNDVIVLSHEVSGYSGGAHGYYTLGMHVLDVQGKRELTLQDVTTADSVTLRTKVERYFREQYHLAKNKHLSEILFGEELWANENFYLTDKGIGFIYNPYEVASWAQGVIEVFVPFSALKGWLTPWVTERMKL